MDHRDCVVRGMPGSRCRRWAWVLTASLGSALGCVERRMTIRSDPPGALVYLDGRELGVTPVSTSFTYYTPGHEIRLLRDRSETLTVIQPVRAPWWDSLPLEFFTENLLPITLRDEREYNFQLPPVVQVPPDQLLQRATLLRQNALSSQQPPLRSRPQRKAARAPRPGQAPPVAAPPTGPARPSLFLDALHSD